MTILHSLHYAEDGTTIFAYQTIDTARPDVLALLKAIKDDPKAQAAAGFAEPCNIPGIADKTRWEVIVQDIAQSDDKAARDIFGL